MSLALPRNQGQELPFKIDTPCCLVAIGANGAGKSYFAKRLCELNAPRGVHIAALKGVYGADRASGRRFVTHLEELMEQMGEPSQLRTLRTIWRDFVPHLTVESADGKAAFCLKATREILSVAEVSDGEKVIFYLLASVLQAPREAVLVVEEPEIHLHDSIKSALWDALEHLRADCSFVYMTHDLDFATSRNCPMRLWIKGHDRSHDRFAYEFIHNQEHLPPSLQMEILGSRRSVLFVEGTDKGSIDIRIYSALFPCLMVRPLGGCQRVIDTTRSFNDQQDFHHLRAYGIVDRDRRIELEVQRLRERQVYAPAVAEVENLLLLPEVVRAAARAGRRDPEKVLAEVRRRVMSLFRCEMEGQILLHARHRIRHLLERTMNIKVNVRRQLVQAIAEVDQHVRPREICLEFEREFRGYLDSDDYLAVLRVFNYKPTFKSCDVASLCGVEGRSGYLRLVVAMLRSGSSGSDAMRTELLSTLGMEELDIAQSPTS